MPSQMFHNADDGDCERSIILTREDIRSARRLLRRLAGDDGSPELDCGVRTFDDTSRDALIARARRDFSNRRRRLAVFGASMFGEAAWDMLLALYILERSDSRQTVGSLMQYSGAPTTTAKRWLDFLQAHGMVDRTPHPTDRRTAFVALTARARSKLDMYYSETADTVL